MSTINKFIERLFTMAGAEVEISPEMIKETEAFLKAETKKASKKVEKKNTKAKKDPNAPKKATNAYMIFATENRGKVLEEMKKTNENVNAKDVLKEMGARWKVADEKTKKKYEKKLAEAKAKYDEEMKNYVPSDAESDSSDTKKTKKAKKDPNAPKKPTNAYMIFATENRGKVLEEMKKTNATVNAKDVLKEMGARWTAAKPDVKTKYEKKLAEAKAKYVEEMKNYAPSASDSEDAPKTKVTKKTKKDVEDVKEAVKEESEDEDAPPPPKEKKVKAKKVEPEMEPEEDNIPPPPPVKKDIKKAKK